MTGESVGDRRRGGRVPTCLQFEPAECGAACLAMILGYHGSRASLEELRDECGVSRDGCNAMNLLHAGRARGLEGSGYRMPLGSLPRAVMPCVVFWRNNHFVVLERMTGEAAWINDPASGRRRVPMREFASAYSGVVLEFHPTPALRRDEPDRGSLGELGLGGPGARADLAFAGASALGAGLAWASVAVIAQTFIDYGLSLGGGGPGWTWALAMGIAGIGLIGFSSLRLTHGERTAARLGVSGSGRLIWHALRLPVEFFERRWSGDVASRLLAHERAARSARDVVGAGISEGAVLLVLLVVMSAYSIGAGLISALALSVAAVGWWTLRSRVGDMVRHSRHEGGRAYSTSVVATRQAESLVASGRVQELFVRWGGHHARAIAAEQGVAIARALAGSIPASGVGICLLAALGFGFARAESGQISAGGETALVLLALLMVRPVFELVRSAESWELARADLAAAQAVTAASPKGIRTISEVTAREHLSVRRLAGSIELRGVTYGFSRQEPPLIERLDLSLGPGDWVAIVGPSGSGKSTVARLAAGLIEPWSGEVLLDGKPRSVHRRSRVANSVSVVDHRPFLFEGTLRENIGLWDRTLRDEAIQRAAIDALIHDDITARRGAYSSRVEDAGRNFSGGQRQRLELARALATDPTVLVLDEAFNALDRSTQMRIHANIRGRGCTVLIVTHRLSLLRDINEIIVLDQGRLAERGDFATLAGADGLFARMLSAEGARL